MTPYRTGAATILCVLKRDFRLSLRTNSWPVAIRMPVARRASRKCASVRKCVVAGLVQQVQGFLNAGTILEFLRSEGPCSFGDLKQTGSLEARTGQADP